jgi:hypothetical protein
MKKTGLLLILCWAVSMPAQEATPLVNHDSPAGTLATNANFPKEQFTTPTHADLYCAGFVNQHPVANVNYVAGGLETPNTTHFATGELIYLAGKGYEAGQRYAIVRELRDPNRYELFNGQFALEKVMGQAYDELGIIQIVDTRSKSAIAHIDFSCAPILPGDIAIPFVEKTAIPFHQPVRFDRFAPSSGKLSGRIAMARDFDSELGTGMKVYFNLGANQGVKAGDYFRVFRSYETDLHNPVDSLSFAASTSDDTQAHPAAIETGMLTSTNGPRIHVADLPRRAVGEVVVLSTTATTSTAMIVFAMEDIHLGDGVELDPQQ